MKQGAAPHWQYALRCRINTRAELLPPQSGKDYNELLMLTKGIPPNIRVRKSKERRER